MEGSFGSPPTHMLTSIKRTLRDRHVVVVGSAPLSDAERDLVSKAEKVVCVNGSVSSTSRVPDVWVCNSREYDDDLYTDPVRWPESRKQLHDEMLRQSAGRHIHQVVFLKKSLTSTQTIQKLHAQGTLWADAIELNPSQKSDIAVAAGVERFQVAFNISAGLWAACLALTCLPASVTLVGFSFTQDYAYRSSSGIRHHIEQDQEALPQIHAQHPELRLSRELYHIVQSTHLPTADV